MIQILSLIAVVINIAYAQCSDDAFTRANEHYKAGNFATAYATYKTIPNPDKNIHFNLGNCAFKLGKKGAALAHWRRAERDWGLSGLEELHHNIAHLRSQIIQIKDTDQPQTISQSLAHMYHATKCTLVPLVRAIPLVNIQVTVLILWILLFVCLRFARRWIGKPYIACLFALFAITASLLAVKYSLNNKTYGVIIATQATMFSGPGSSFSALGQLPEASEVVILRQSGDFYKIRHARKLGWITQQDIECFQG